LEVGEVFWDINFGKCWDYIVWKEFFIKIYSVYWNCKYLVSFSGFDIGGCLLDWRLYCLGKAPAVFNVLLTKQR
jgi:hypothetical protein